MNGGGAQEAPPIVSELLAVGAYWRRQSPFSSGMQPRQFAHALVDGPTPTLVPLGLNRFGELKIKRLPGVKKGKWWWVTEELEGRKGGHDWAGTRFDKKALYSHLKQ